MHVDRRNFGVNGFGIYEMDKLPKFLQNYNEQNATEPVFFRSKTVLAGSLEVA